MSNLNKIFAGSCNFVIGASNIKDIPESSLNEVAFIGRSNVGKSSLLNSLVNQKKLARVSKNPGCTRQINFFNLNNLIYIVDLPGYGYAKISKTDRKQWDHLINSYLLERRSLKRIFLLIDSRHEVKSTDLHAMEYLDNLAISYQLVLTKTDKITASQQKSQIEQYQNLATKHGACYPEIISTSSYSKIGIEALRESIVQCI